MRNKSVCTLILLASLPFLVSAQTRSRRNFADWLLLGAHYGYSENYREERDLFFEREHYANLRAGISLTPSLYAGIQSRFVRARNFENDFQPFYMAGVWTRGYLLHPRPLKSRALNRIGAFLEAGFSMGNYAFDYRPDGVQYYFQRNGNWYIPMAMGLEYLVWRGLTLEGSLNMVYNNGGSWEDQGFAYLSIGANWHW